MPNNTQRQLQAQEQIELLTDIVMREAKQLEEQGIQNALDNDYDAVQAVLNKLDNAKKILRGKTISNSL